MDFVSQYSETAILWGYFLLTVWAAFLTVRLSTTKEVRNQTRERIKQEINHNKNKWVQSSQKSELEEMIVQAGRPFDLSAIKFQFFRYGLLLLLTFYYVLLPWLNGQINTTTLAVLVGLFLVTSPVFRFSVTHHLFRRLQLLRLTRMNSELFMLYDMVQSELSNLRDDQEINAYNLLYDMQSYFVYVDKPLAKMLSLWKQNKEKTAEEFHRMMPTGEARALVDILIRMDQTSCKEALVLVKGLAESFTTAYVENQRRKKDVIDHLLNIPTFGTQLLIIANVVVVVLLEVSDLIDFTNLPGS
ncbi:MAG TPA: hypothetical protein VGE40_01270 [Bacilli bacterium]